MFYSYEILQKRGGRFGNIWLAATNMSKLTRREIASVYVAKSCDDVLAFVEKRVPPSNPGGKRPRFSLYLSAQLMYGLTRIYQKQSFFLLLDAANTFVRVGMMPRHDINLMDVPRGDLVTQPDIAANASLVIDTSIDQIMNFELSDENLKSMFWGLSSGSDRSSSVGSRQSIMNRTSDAEDMGPVVPNEQITLVDPPPIIVNTPLSPLPVPKDEELPPMNGQELNMFLDMMPEARLSVDDLLPTSTPMNKGQNGHTRPTIGSPILEVPLEKTPTKRSTPHSAPRTRAVPPSPGVTQQIFTSPPVRRATRKSLRMELTPLLPSPARKRQRKQAVFADRETQISKTDQKQQFLSGADTTRKFLLESPHVETVDDLFKRPSRRGFRPEVSTGIWAGTARYRTQIPEDQMPPIESPITSEEERDSSRDTEMPANLGIQADTDIPIDHGIQTDHGMQTDHGIQTDQGMPTDRGMQTDQNLLDLDPIQLVLDITVPDIQPRRSVPGPEFITPASGVRSRKRRKNTLEESLENLRKTGSALDMHGSGVETPSLIERQRDASGSRLSGSVNLDDTLILDDSRRLRPDHSASKRPRSSQSGANISMVPPSHTPSKSTLLYDLPEETSFNNQPLLDVTPSDLQNDEDFLLDNITNNLTSQNCQTTTFRMVCPPEHNDMRAASKYFTALLNLATSKRIKVKQWVKYGDISIRLQD